MYDVTIVKTTSDRHLLRRGSRRRLNTNEQSVVGVVDQTIAENVRPNTAVIRSERDALEGWGRERGLFKAVRVSRDG